VNVSRVRYLHDWFRVWVNFASFLNRKYEPALHGAKFALQGCKKMSWKTYLKEQNQQTTKIRMRSCSYLFRMRIYVLILKILVVTERYVFKKEKLERILFFKNLSHDA